MRLNAQDIVRIKDNKNDSLYQTFDNIDTIFKKQKVNNKIIGCVDSNFELKSSIEYMLKAYKRNRESNGCVFLAWNVVKPGHKPKLVGIAVCLTFELHQDFTTDEESLLPEDYLILKDYIPTPENHYKKHYYIDTMCSLQRGVGRILVLHAYEYAQRKNMSGIIALSWTPNADNEPQSKPTFESLGFNKIISDFKSKEPLIAGNWMWKSTKIRPQNNRNMRMIMRMKFALERRLGWREQRLVKALHTTGADP